MAINQNNFLMPKCKTCKHRFSTGYHPCYNCFINADDPNMDGYEYDDKLEHD